MSPLMQRILSVVRKTGDRCIVMDTTTEEAFVLMNLAQYEALLSNTTERLTAVKSPSTIVPDTREVPKPVPIIEKLPQAPRDDFFPEPSQDKIIEDERFYLEPID